MFRHYPSNRPFRFRRFCHKAYAAFRSLHREVTIGRIAGYMTDLEMLKQGKSIALSAALLIAGACPAEADDNAADDPPAAANRQLQLQEVQVVSHKAEVHSESYRLITQVSRAEIAALPVQSVADILRYLPGIDVRTRGASGVQEDLSMRGGTFDQVLVLLNGVAFNDAQTGHYTLNLPVPVELIERIEVLQGTSASLSGAFSGAVNIVTRHTQEVTMKLSAGMNGLVQPEAAASVQAGDTHINAGGCYSRSEGYHAPSPSEKESTALRNSDYQKADVYAQVRWRGLDVQTGAQWKDAGLGMGYGFGSQDQFDATRTAFASVRHIHRTGAWRTEASASYRANHDRYEWHRGQRQYGNRHFAQTASASLSAHYASRIGTTSFGAGIRNENIQSTNIGDSIRPLLPDLVRGANRLHATYYAEQTFHYAGLSASAGVNGTYNTQYGHHTGGGANIGYEFAHNHHVYANANRSLRLPTFTDLYYDAGNQLGNRALQPETAWLLSAGCKGEEAFAHGTLTYAADWYYRWGRNIIDWVYTPEDTRRPYHASNQQQANATGTEVSVAYRLNEWLRCIAADYAYTWLDMNLKESGSRYLDYLSHKLTLRVEHGIYKGLGASWTVRFQKREGQYNDADGNVQDYRPVWLLDGAVYWQNSYLRVSAECTNMTNRHYYDYGGILQPGAWAKISLRATL